MSVRVNKPRIAIHKRRVRSCSESNALRGVAPNQPAFRVNLLGQVLDLEEATDVIEARHLVVGQEDSLHGWECVKPLNELDPIAPQIELRE